MELLTIANLQRHPRLQRDGKGPAENTIRRWIADGINIAGAGRVRLEIERQGGRIFIRPDALDRFIEQCSCPAKTMPVRRESIATICKRMRDRGFLKPARMAVSHN